MTIIIAILAVIFVLGVAINIHEFGHFIVAKLLGMRVEAYSFFGLGPRIWGFKIGNTDYRVSAIPLGAYVKLYGDEATAPLEGGSSEEKVEAFMDERNIGAADPGKTPAFEPVLDSELYELRPRWQKFLVMVGGPFMNIVLALAIPFSLALIQGVPATPSPIVGYVKTGGAADKAGIKVGDRIVAFDGEENPTWERVRNDSLISPEKEIPVTVERNGQRLSLTVTPTKFTDSGNTVGFLDLEPEGGVEPVVVEQAPEGMPASEAGLKKGDLIISFNGAPTRNQMEVRQKIIDNGANPIKLTINRDNQAREIMVTPKVADGEKAKIGVQFSSQYANARESVTVPQAFAYAWHTNVEILRLTGKAFGQVSKGERSAGETFSGPIGIVQIISQIANNAGFEDLLGVLGLISLNLGIFNLLPIPMLDGGQIMVLAIEGFLALFGMTLSMKIKEKIQLVGLAAILLLMVFTIFNDVSRFFR